MHRAHLFTVNRCAFCFLCPHPLSDLLMNIIASPSPLRQTIYQLIDLVFPPRCAGCGRLDCLWCDGCAAQIEATRNFEYMADVPPLAAVFSLAAHAAPLRDAVQRLKYESDRWQAVGLAKVLIADLGTTGDALDDFVTMAGIQAVVPVPLHGERLKIRGYNQAELLSERVAERLNLAHLPHALIREKNTGQQVGRTADERQAAMLGAFIVNTAHLPHLAGARLLLVDDVLTTGATLGACAETLLENGAEAIYAFTLTRA